jgi:hypothetical protein
MELTRNSQSFQAHIELLLGQSFNRIPTGIENYRIVRASKYAGGIFALLHRINGFTDHLT